MNLKDYNQKRQNPELHYAVVMDRLIADLEQILAQLPTRIDPVLAGVTTFTEAKRLEIDTLLAQLRSATVGLEEEVAQKLDGVQASLDSFSKETDARLSEHDARYQKEVLEVFNHVQKKVDAIKLMRGPQGERGAQGIPGKDGQGKDGSPDTGEEIATKLNTTKDSVAMSVITGLVDRLQRIERELSTKTAKKASGGGGGMGNTQHETFAVSSATTTITTDFPIAGGGYAIMGMYYQGQFQARGTHYTVGTDRRTITLTFTPDDNTSIDITYIR